MQKQLNSFIQLSKNRYIEKDTGYLICENAVLGSTGYQEYFAHELNIDTLPPNTKVKVYRPEEEVFKEESLRTLENKAICVLHPDEMVNSSNDSILRKGSVFNVRRENNVIKGTLQITDKDTIEKSKYIKCLSLGYNLDLELMDSDSNDGTIFIAKNIRYNHIALVPKGRSKVAMITDNAIGDKNNNIGGNKYMSLFSKNVRVADAEVEEKDKDLESVKADDECGKTMDEESKEQKEKVEKRDEKEGAEEDTVTKEIEKRVAKGDYTQKDLEKLLEKLKKGETKKIDEDYKERKEEEKSAKDSITISRDEYKSLLMAQKGMVFGNDKDAFVKKQATDNETKALDAEAERKLYYKRTLNPHKNPNWRNECGNLSDLLY